MTAMDTHHISSGSAIPETGCDYVLIELGHAPKKIRNSTLAALSSLEHAYLFAETQEEDIQTLGPLLVRLSDASVGSTEVLAYWEREHPSAIAYLGAVADFPQLTAHLRNRLLVTLPDGEERLFRYYEPSTFDYLQRELDNEQYHAFWEPISWWRLWAPTERWVTYQPENDARREPALARAEEIAKPRFNLRPGYFRLNGPMWDRLRFDADMRQIRRVIEEGTAYRWFTGLDKATRDKVFFTLAHQPLQASGMSGVDDLFAGTRFALDYPLYDVWAVPGVQKAVAEACEGGNFAQVLDRHMSEEDWNALEDDAEGDTDAS